MTLYHNANTWNGGYGTGDELPEIGASIGRSTVSTEPRRKPREANGKLTGRVTMYSIERGFGFIRCGADNYFFHRTALANGLEYVIKGETVLFELGQGRGGKLAAMNINLVK